MTVTTAPPPGTTAPAPGNAPPGLAAAIRVELTKLLTQWPLRIAFAVCVVAPVAFAVFAKAQWPSGPSDTLFGRWSGTTGFAESLTLLNSAAIYGAPVLAGLFAGDIFAGEDRHGTWKMLLTRSASRTHIFAGKAIAATVCVWAAFAAAAIVSLVAGLAVDGSAPLVGLSGQLIPAGQAWGLVAAAWAVALLPATAFIALGLLLSIASRSTVVGVLGPLVIAAALQILEIIDGSQFVRAISPATPLDAWHALFTSPGNAGTVIEGAVTSLVWAAVFAAAAWHVLRKRPFAASDAVPRAQRRATAGIIAVAVVILAVLAAASGQGPTVLTAKRLGASIAATFGNLAAVHARWLTGTAGGAPPPMRALCDRGAGAQQSSGQGDNWSCTMIDTRAADAEQQVILDVTLKANGCYTAEAGSSLGALLLRSYAGKTYINPLYAFDGCLGTP
ncbi:MAG TPA: ABC transporter permease subunit [Trebonia sp.]|jgi:ABC-2 type transport system permease protein|nr:ABC transporter permease subunit [Trebonia sp.]